MRHLCHPLPNPPPINGGGKGGGNATIMLHCKERIYAFPTQDKSRATIFYFSLYLLTG